MKSLALLTVFFPLIIPIWKEKPFNATNIKQPDALTFLTEEEIKEQKKFLNLVKDPRIRSRIAGVYSGANNAEAFIVLEDSLQKEKNSLVVEDILFSMHFFKDNVKLKRPEKLKKLLESKSPRTRAFAASILLASTGNAGQTLEFLEKENSEFVQNMLWDQLAQDKSQLPLSKAKKFLDSKDISKKSGAAKAIAAKAESPNSITELRKILEDKEPLPRIALAKGLKRRKSGGDALLKKLAKDKNITTRAITASAPATDTREELFIELSNDNDWEVRKLSAESLGNYKSPEAVQALMSKLGDESKPVRTAVEESLAKIRPGKETIEELEKALNDPEKQNAAIRTLGLLGAKSASAKILKILQSTKSDETMRRAINALGRLKFKESASAIADKAKNKDENVRKAVAFALGRLAEKPTFETLIELSKDKKLPVSLEAVESMGRIGDATFNKRLFDIIKNTGMKGNSEMRAAACWSIARIGSPDAKTLKQLNDILLKKVVAAEMEKVFDNDYTRAAALLAMVDLAKKDKKLEQQLDKAIDYFYHNPFKMEGEDSPLLLDYMRQITLYRKGEKIEKAPLETVKPHFVASKYDGKTKPKEVKDIFADDGGDIFGGPQKVAPPKEQPKKASKKKKSKKKKNKKTNTKLQSKRQ
jgi:HEAT repeat protein/DNA polymerase III psi subunit